MANQVSGGSESEEDMSEDDSGSEDEEDEVTPQWVSRSFVSLS